MPHPLLRSTFATMSNVFIANPVLNSKHFAAVFLNSAWFFFEVLCFFVKNIRCKKVINFHYPNIRFMPAFILARILRLEIKISIWGSDFLKAAGFRSKILEFMIRNSDGISVASESMVDLLKTKYAAIKKKVYIAPFSIPFIDQYIKTKSVLQISAAKKIRILCGTNGSENQQFLAIARAINATPIDFREKVQFFFHMAYGGNRQKELVEIIDKEIDIIFSTDYHYGQELVNFRKKFQVLVQIQKTDQLSAAMIEHLALGAIVITGRWLPYESLINYGIYIYLIDDANDLGDAITEVATSFDHYSKLCQNNKEIISEKFSTRATQEAWRSFLM